ncbi:MAG: hypothetical protein GY781_07790 [Gammaproteobacteria bacterium]|nr:hypothetical protein [Gammaproteobacteria bacterium]
MGEELQITAVVTIGSLISLMSILLGSTFRYEISFERNLYKCVLIKAFVQLPSSFGVVVYE